MSVYPDNKISSFKTKLPAPIDLQDGRVWEVGLTDIIYPKTWLNNQRDDPGEYIEFWEWSPTAPPPDPEDAFNSKLTSLFGGSSGSGGPKSTKIDLPPGYFSTPQDVVDALNRLLPTQDLSFLWWRELSALTMTLRNRLIKVRMGAGLRKRLGFDENRAVRFNQNAGYSGDDYLGPMLLTSGLNADVVVMTDGKLLQESTTHSPPTGIKEITYTSTHPPDLHGNLTALFVYCNLVQERPVGDSMVSLLRVVPAKGKQGDTVNIAFQPVHYLALNQTYFQTVEIDIRDDTGRLVPFEAGRVVVTLHLRPQK
jgi:hypothetical protein